MRLAAWLIIPPVLIFGLAVALVSVPLPAGLPEPFAMERNLPAAILTGVLGFAWVVSLAFLTLRSFLRAGARYDGIFAEIGFASASHLGFGRSYTGRLNGRDVEVLVVPARASQRPVFDVRMSARPRNGFSVSNGTPLLDGRAWPVVATIPASVPMTVRSTSPESAQRILSESRFSAALASLTDPSTYGAATELYVHHHEVRWRPGTGHVAPEDVVRSLELLALAAAASER